MFESLVEVRRERTPARKAWTLPIALAFHASALALMFLYSVFAHQALVPPCRVFLTSPVDVIPVQLGGFSGSEKPVSEVPPPERKPEPPDSTRLLQPDPERDMDPDNALRPERPEHSPFHFGTGEVGPSGPGRRDGVPWGDPGGDENAQPPQPSPIRRMLPNEAGLVSALQAVRQPQPLYPPALSSMGVSGRVELEIVVDESGRVESVTVVGSTNDLFARAAVDAVRTWLYRPPVSKAGARVAVTKRVVVNFFPR